MDVTNLKKGERAEIVSVEEPYRARLGALDFRAGEKILLIKISFAKKTYLVEAGRICAMRREVARCIKVRKL